ncbi:phosphonate ABC transporter ATP-binding protein [Arcobacter sp. FWKO B]|uniref:phosphonate ABC transporter ATP-binding protein n=1 Tax=Arcobacter sp. FWKO B TaxID=2593672 RepID=UPI001907DAB7|nr:ATP-binding cassette domain-containing protein [Arcobacter sp. FWKO B]
MVNNNTDIIFKLENVSKNFGTTKVIDNISLTINLGEKVAVIGPSGAGKTTLFRLMSGIIHPNDGRLEIFGIDSAKLNSKNLKKIRRNIGVLYQNDNLISQLRVVHNVLMGKLGVWNIFKSILSLIWPQDIALAKEALKKVELQDKLWAMPTELSGGQQQRVALARLLVQEPKVMLADEPVSQLDIRLGREIIEILSNIASNLNNTLIVNLHTLELLHGHFDRVIALKNGKIFWEGKPEELTQEILFELYGAEYKTLHLG